MRVIAKNGGHTESTEYTELRFASLSLRADEDVL